MSRRVFVINPGSTSTKIAFFDGETALLEREYAHSKDSLAGFKTIVDQMDLRRQRISKLMQEFDMGEVDAVAGRGGLLRPMSGGVYSVNSLMLDDLRTARYGEHPCNLGALLADEYAREWSVPAFVVDPVVTDEMDDVARITGHPKVERRSIFHALSQRGAARSAAESAGVGYENEKFIVAHMGGGISIGAHLRGRIVDVVNALDGEGPFSPERTGRLPMITVLNLLEQGRVDIPTLKKIVLTQGGLWAHLGTNDLRDVEEMMNNGDQKAALLFKALAYNISKEISALGPALMNNDDQPIRAVVLTGGMARSERLVAEITGMLQWLAPVKVVETNEMAVMASGAFMALNGMVEVKSY